MGVKEGYVSNAEGDKITVIFESPYIVNAELDIEAVSIQMSAGGYTPVKYACATIDIISNRSQDTDLLTKEEVRVTVYNENTGEFLFVGYVQPNNYNIQITGVNDSLTIECVDLLGFAKFLPYTLVNEKGPRVVELRNAMLQATAILSQRPQVYVADVILLKNYVVGANEHRTTRRYDLLTVLETYFMTNGIPAILGANESGEVSYAPNMMSCYDVLAMIAESLRMSWVQVGGDIYLHDYLQVQKYGTSTYRSIDSITAPKEVERGVIHVLDEESFEGTTVDISATPRYSLVQLERECEEERKVLPELFDIAYMYKNGPKVGDGKMWAQRLVSRLCATHGTSSFIGYSPEDDDATSGEYWNRRWSTVLRLGGAWDNSALFSYRFQLPVEGGRNVGFRLNWDVMFSDDETALYPEKSPKEIEDAIVVCSLKVGGKWLEAPSSDNMFLGAWVNEPTYLTVHSKGETGWNNTAWLQAGYFIYDLTKTVFGVGNPGGVVEFTIHSAETRNWKVMYLKNINLNYILAWEGVEEDTLIPKTKQIGTWTALKETPVVKLPIQANVPTVGKTFGMNVLGVDYYNSEDSQGMRFGSEEMSMIERIEALENFGDGLEYSIPLRDESNKIKAFDVFASPRWVGNKVVVGYDRDVINSSINVILD